jgi:hypothetical protein
MLRASACLSITPAPPLAVIDVSTGEVMTAQLFVAVLGASSYTYAEAARTRACSTGSARTRALVSFMGDVSATVVGDSLRSGVTRACFYEPAVNRTYAEMALTTALQFCRRDRIGPGVQVASRFVFQAAQPAILLAHTLKTACQVARGGRRRSDTMATIAATEKDWRAVAVLVEKRSAFWPREVSFIAIGPAGEDLHAVVEPRLEEQHLVMTETVPPRPFDDMEALTWLRSQPDERVTASAADTAGNGLDQDADRSPVEDVGEGWLHPLLW